MYMRGEVDILLKGVRSGVVGSDLGSLEFHKVDVSQHDRERVRAAETLHPARL